MRYGKFTSSEIWKLCTNGQKKGSFGKPALTYIEERRMQKRFGKSFVSHGSPATKWGLLMEPEAFARHRQRSGQHLISYSNPETDFQESHIPNHGGTPDFVSFDGSVVGSIKCPFTEAAFIMLWDICKAEKTEVFKEQSPEYYWQLISDAITTKATVCTLVVFMPYEDERFSLLMDSELYWLNDAPGVIRGTEFEDLISWSFIPPQEDIDFLTDRIIRANDKLNSPSVVVAHYDPDVKATIIE